jgi:hypothetical protein
MNIVFKENMIMSKNSSNKIVVPEAKEAMNKFKMEAANEVGVNLKQGYNGDLTSRQAGSVGGQMVNKMYPIRTAKFARADRTAIGHEIKVRYITSITI